MDTRRGVRLKNRINELCTARNCINDQIDDLVLTLVELEVREKQQGKFLVNRRIFRRGMRVTILSGDLKDETAVLLRRLSVKELNEDNRWEFRIIGGSHNGRVTWRKQKNLVFIEQTEAEA